VSRRLSQTRGAVRRTAGELSAATRLLIVCGAEGTEPEYIRGLNRHLRNPSVQIKVLEKGRAPAQVVDYGIRRARAAERCGEGYDQLWCVVDVDDYTDHDSAIRTAAEQKSPEAHVIVSNPCFELWLLLHFKDVRHALGGYAGVKPHMAKHVPGYDKTVQFARDYAARYPEAMRRAKSLEPTGERWRANPSTAMWRLVEAMGGCVCHPAVHSPGLRVQRAPGTEVS
jgi:hypothetical protein